MMSNICKSLVLLVYMCIVMPASFSYASSYLDSKLFINTTNQFLIKANALLDDEISVVLDSSTLAEVASFFTQKFNVPFYVKASVKDRKVEIIEDKVKVSELVKKISDQAHCFFVLRSNYILISDKAQFLMRPQFEITTVNLQKLEKYINSTGSTVFVEPTKILASLTYTGLVKFREFLLEDPVATEIVRTDLLVPFKGF